MSESTKAVFLSYASQDVVASLRLCAALRAAGIEVWFDQDALVGGDAWDQKIRGQIGTCALFVPVISANTQVRDEGYFRLEWKLAVDRSHLIAQDKAFLLPVVIDATPDASARVPVEFRAVQWTRLPGGETSAAFVARAQKLLGGPATEPTTSTARPLDEAQGRLVSAPAFGSSVNSEVTAKNLEISADVRLSPESGFETFVPRRSLWRRLLPVVITAAVAVLLTIAVESRLRPAPAPAPVSRFSYRIPDGQEFRGWQRNVLAVSPDGRKFAFNLTGGLYLRSLDELEARLIPGTGELLVDLFFSPDGQSVGYWQNEQLKRIGITGGTPVVICTTAQTNGASWAPDGTILFGQREGIMRVPATGGTPAVIIPRQKTNALWNPQLLPDGDTVLFTEASRTLPSTGETRIVVQKISTGERKVLVEGGVDARYLATGHLVYVAGDVLMGAAFDARRLAITRGTVPVVQGMMRFHSPSIFVGNFGIAADGTLVWIYSAVSGTSDVWQLGLGDRAGKLTPLALPPGPYDTPRASPDGTRIAVGVANSKEAYVAIYDLDGKTTLRRLTFGGNNRYPVWSRDGQRVAFQSDREGDLAIFWQRADGTAPAERLTKPEKEAAHVPASWSPKDETLLFIVLSSKDSVATGTLWTYARASGTVAPFGNVKEAGQSPMFSPDGRWVVYAVRGGSSAGNAGIYVQPFPATGAQSALQRMPGDNSGAHGFWSSDGTTLTFGPGPKRLAAVTVTTEPAFAFGKQTPVPHPFASNVAGPSAPRAYDVMPDGRMVGLIAPGQSADTAGTGPSEIRIVEHWTEELKRLVPVK